MKVEKRGGFWSTDLLDSILCKPYNNFLKSINAIIILMMGKWRQGFCELTNMKYCHLLSPRLLPVIGVVLCWGGVEAKEAGPYPMKCRACSGVQRLNMEEFENDRGYLENFGRTTRKKAKGGKKV